MYIGFAIVHNSQIGEAIIITNGRKKETHRRGQIQIYNYHQSNGEGKENHMDTKEVPQGNKTV
jgi:hypothetical protein